MVVYSLFETSTFIIMNMKPFKLSPHLNKQQVCGFKQPDVIQIQCYSNVNIGLTWFLFNLPSIKNTLINN